MKKNVLILSAGTVIISLLMISSTTAMPINPQKNTSNSGLNVTNYIDPNIHISVLQKRILRDAIEYIDDQDVRLLLQELVKKKGPVDSNDIEQIIKKNNLVIGTITFGGIVAGGPGVYHDTSGGAAFCPRRPLCALFVILPIIFLYIHAFFQESVDNSPDYPVQISIDGKFIDYEVRVFAIGFIGSVGVNPAPNMGFRCSGWAPIIIY
jgi:hypothetical protein